MRRQRIQGNFRDRDITLMNDIVMAATKCDLKLLLTPTTILFLKYKHIVLIMLTKHVLLNATVQNGIILY